MKRTVLLLVSLLIGTAASCNKGSSDLNISPDYTKARVMYNSCAGTVLQFIPSSPSIGKDWLWYKNLNGPFNASNSAESYPGCVSAFDVPLNRQNVGDTLTFCFTQLSTPPGTICAIGGIPTVYISVKQLK